LGKQPSEEEETSGDSTPSHRHVTVASTGTPGPWRSASSTRTARACGIGTCTPARRRFSGALPPIGPTWSSRSPAWSPGTWLADLGAHEGRPCVLGHALSMQASHGGTATHDTIAAHTIAVLLRGGLRPQASVAPAARRASRDLLRRRRPLRRQGAERRTPIPPTHRPYTLPALGQKLADQAQRGGVAERVAEPAWYQRLEVDRAWIGPDDARLRDREWSVLSTAQEHHTNTRSWLRTGPALGERLRLVLRDDSHDIHRVPRVQDVGSSCRRVNGAKASAGKRDGPGGRTLGTADLTWAFSEAAGLLWRDHPSGPNALPVWRTHPARARPCPAWPSTGLVRSRAWETATRRARCTHCSPARGVERGSLTPHRTATG
jgi:hypothetical protein